MGNYSSVEKKVCAACEKRIPLAEYHNNKHSPDGKRDRCPTCIKDKRAPMQKPRAESAPKQDNDPDIEASAGSVNHGYMYVIQEREFIRMGEPVYKIGMTNQFNPRTRLQHYPADSCVLLLMRKPDARASENAVIDMLRANRNLKHRSDIGKEYFEGDPTLIINVVIIS